MNKPELSRFDKIFISVGNILGIKIFKKYWVVGGSYWNTTHINKNNESDLKYVISDANNYTKQHIQGFTTELIMFGGMAISSTLSSIFMKKTINMEFNYLCVGVVFTVGIYHGYAFFAHHYNRIKASHQLSLLKYMKRENEIKHENEIIKSDDDDDNEMIKLNDDEIILISKFGRDKYHLSFSYYDKISPYFLTLNDALEYRTYLKTLYGNKVSQKLYDDLFFDKMKDNYQKYVNTINATSTHI